MSERRSLTQGLQETPGPIVPTKEQSFVYGERKPPTAVAQPARVSVSTRMRSDFATALKRASLERQLQGLAPNTLQDILEEAVEPWLRGNGYLT